MQNPRNEKHAKLKIMSQYYVTTTNDIRIHSKCFKFLSNLQFFIRTLSWTNLPHEHLNTVSTPRPHADTGTTIWTETSHLCLMSLHTSRFTSLSLDYWTLLWMFIRISLSKSQRWLLPVSKCHRVKKERKVNREPWIDSTWETCIYACIFFSCVRH